MTSRQLASRMLLVVALGLSSGCALMTPDCTQNWHDAGFVDGRTGLPARDVQDQYSCGARFDSGQYVDGWHEGYDSRPGIGA